MSGDGYGAYRYIFKKRMKSSGRLQSTASMKRKIENDLALGAGTERVKSRDAIYHITETFRTAFDLCGRHNAGLLAGTSDFPESQKEEYQSVAGKGKPGENLKRGITGQEQGQPVFMHAQGFEDYESTAQERTSGNFYNKFSEVAFRNGHLASAVLQNGGKTMFVSCMKRALGQSGPFNFLQSKLFSPSSVHMPVKNSSAKAVFNRYTNSAVGLVVDSIHSARQTLQFFQRMSLEEPEKAVTGMKGDTLANIYPFLHTSEDMERKVKYEEKLRELTLRERQAVTCEERTEIANLKAVLNAGIIKIQGLISRKSQMQHQFFCQLGQLLENSQKAEEIFSSQDFVSEVVEELENSMDLPEDDGDDKNKSKPENPSEGYET